MKLVFDIGGTYTRIALFKGNELIEQEKYETIKTNKFLPWLIKKTKEVMKKYNIRKFEGISIAAPGALNATKLELTAPVNLPKIRNLKFSALKKYGKKVVMENDANCAALGAYVLYKKKNIVCLTLGTGLGCGIVLDGKIYNGVRIASEFGHTTVDLHGKRDNCGNYGCLENYLSTRGLLKLARKNGLNLDTYELQKLAGKGDKRALKSYDEFSEYLAVALVNLINTLDPELIVLSGGLINVSEFFVDKAIKEAKSRWFPGACGEIKIYYGNLSLIGAFELLK